jgi:ATP-dependent RNA helicase DeaD
MEILNNVQLEGRRINVEISKMMVAEDVIITEEVLVVVVLVAEEVLLQEEKEFCTKKKVQVVVEGQKLRSQRRWICEEAPPREGGFGGRSSAPRGEGSSDRAPRRSESFGDAPRPRRPRRD